MAGWKYSDPINELGLSIVIDEGTLARTEMPLPGVLGIELAKKKVPKGINQKEWDQIHNYQYPTRRKLRCCLFWTSNTQKKDASKYVTAADELLTDHNLILDVCPSDAKKTAARTIQFNELVDISHYEELRQLVHQNHYDEGRIPVIFCRFAGSLGGESHDTGVTVKTLEDWLPFILINDDKQIMDDLTLLHEMGHASNCGHMKTSDNLDVHNFMAYAPPKRKGILRKQVIKLARSYFTRDA
ncbi:MAG: hypothetical protein GQ581_02320 [Methyloprofundus sp.]|nr:hypothetical protein [Methyloprofundus sp.]